MRKQGEGKREEGKEAVVSDRWSVVGGHRSRMLRWAGPAVIVMAAAVAVAPQLMKGNTCGHDFDFHLVSWMDARASWHEGILYPHWAASANYGAGEPRFVFYPPLTWMLGAALGLAMPWTLVPIALTFLLLAGTGLATRALAKMALSDRTAALAGCAAIFSGYALFTAYERSAFGELAGGVWIPLVLLCALRRGAAGETRPAGRSAWRSEWNGSAGVAVAIAGAWLSNAPVGVMASYLLAAVAAALSIRRRSFAPVVRASAGMVLGLGLAAIYLMPAAVEQKWIDIAQAVDDPGLKIENGWLFAYHANKALAEHDSVLFKVSRIAVTMIAIALAGSVIHWLRVRGARAPDSAAAGSRELEFWLVIAAIPMVVLLLQLPVSWPIWSLLPKMRFLQFPWRWLVAVEAPMGILVAAAVWPAKRWRQVAAATAVLPAFACMIHLAGHNWFQRCDEEDAVAPMVAVAKTGAGFAGTGEYQPAGADATEIAEGLPGACLVTDADAALGRVPGTAEDDSDATPVWDEQQGSCDQTFPASPVAVRGRAEHFGLIAVTDHAGYLVLRLTRYPAWQVTVNGRAAQNPHKRDDGLLAVPVPAGPVALSADWTTTPDVVAGRWISGISAMAMAGLAIAGGRRPRTRNKLGFESRG